MLGLFTKKQQHTSDIINFKFEKKLLIGSTDAYVSSKGNIDTGDLDYGTMCNTLAVFNSTQVGIMYLNKKKYKTKSDKELVLRYNPDVHCTEYPMGSNYNLIYKSSTIYTRICLNRDLKPVIYHMPHLYFIRIRRMFFFNTYNFDLSEMVDQGEAYKFRGKYTRPDTKVLEARPMVYVRDKCISCSRTLLTPKTNNYMDVKESNIIQNFLF